MVVNGVKKTSLLVRLFGLFIIVISLWAALFLAVPDALTYAKYAALNGAIVSKYLHWHRAGLWIGIGAPLGVYIFAFNNLYRFMVLVLSDLYKVRLYNLARLRYCGFAVILILSLISMVPFYGMAYQAGIPMPFVLANSFARFCMNTFAFFFLWSYFLDRRIMRSSSTLTSNVVRIDRILHALAIGVIPESVLVAKPDIGWAKEMLKNYKVPALADTPKQDTVFQTVSVVSFVVGVITALYLFGFAYAAATHMGWGKYSVLVASLGVIPTCLLWGHDARFSWCVPVKFLICNGIMPNRWMRFVRYANPLKVIYLLLIALAVIFISLPATLSETIMAWHATHGLMRILIEWVAVPAFIGIYTTGIIEIITRIVDWLQRTIHPKTMLTKHQLCARRLRELRQSILREKG